MSETKEEIKKDSKTKALLSGWIRAIISLSLLVFLLFTLDLKQLASVFKNVHIEIIVVVFLLDIGLRLFCAYRWYVLLNRTHPEFRLGEITRVTFVANFIGQFFPGWLGIEAVRIYGMAKNTSDLAGSFTSVFVDRTLGLLSLLIMVCIGLIFAPEGLHPGIKQLAWFFLFLILVASIAIFHPLPRKIVDAVLPKRLKSIIENKLTKLYASIDEYKAWPGTLSWALLLAIAFQCSRIAVAYVAALSLGVQPDMLYFFALFPIIIFLVFLPISIGGLGVREVSFVYFFSTFGIIEEAPAFAISVVLFISSLISTLPGAYFYGTARQPKK